MRSGIRIMRLFGINIYVDWSWIFIFLLVTWNLVGAVFPFYHPEWNLGLSLIVGVAASILFFASVLAHELAHSLVAKANGLPVRNITLFIFGGVSNIEREPTSPKTEFIMAVVGPLTSILIGILALFLGRAMAGNINLLQNPSTAIRSLNPISTLLLWLGPINLLLGIFNLVPGFPLDGGRVLRSILWAISGNVRTATRWATWVGQAIAWIFIALGIAMAFGLEVPVLGGGLINGLWLAFIGWFLNNAATQAYRQVVIQDILEGVTVSRVMRSEPPSVPPTLPISSLVDQYLMGTDERGFPVIDQGSLVGMVCLEDIRKIPRDAWDRTTVSQVMTPVKDLDVTTPQEDVSDALDKLSRKDVRQMPVVSDGHVVGLLRRRDILKWLQLHSDSFTQR